MNVEIRREAGVQVAVKRASGPTEVAALHREARMLGLARHPGVVEVVELRSATADDGSERAHATAAELVTRAVGHLSLATFAPRDLDQAVALVAACAETVADLHALGIVHGRLVPSHVLIDERGRPVLTGFRGAALVGEQPAERGGTADPVRPATDVAALGRLVGHVADGPPETDPIPDKRFTKRTRAATYQRRALLNLADQATTDQPTARPSARALAASMHAIAPDATFGRPSPAGSPTRPRLRAPVAEPDGRRPAPSGATDDAAEPHPDPAAPPLPRRRPEPPRPRPARAGAHRGRGLPMAAALCGVVVVGFGVASVHHGDRPTLAADLAAPTSTPTSVRTVPTTTPPGSTRSRPAGCAVTTPAEGTSATAGPCRRSTAVGAAILNGGHRYAIGQEGDEVLVGDWTCTGTPVPAVIRPSTGDVFVFDTWATADADVTATPALRTAAGSHLETGDDDAGCPTLLAGDGAPLTAVPIERRSS